MENKNQKTIISWEVGGEKKDSTAIGSIALVSLLSFLASGYNFYKKEFLVALVFLILALVLGWYLFSSSSKKAKVSLTENGFIINNQFYAFANMKGYWFSQSNNTLYLVSKKKLSATTAVPLGNQNAEKIKSYLPDTIVEMPYQGEDLADKMSRLLRF